MCRLYGHATDAEITQALMALARETKAKGWWQSYGDVIPTSFELYVGLEAAAAGISWYEPDVVPGLLQTEAYARTILDKGGPKEFEPAELDRRVALRMERQKLLMRKKPAPLRLDVVLGEAVLRRAVGSPTVMAEQLRHLLIVSEQVPSVEIRLVDYSVGVHHQALEIGSFEMLEFPLTPDGKRTEPSTTYVSLGCGALYLEKPREISYYQKVWRNLHESALDEAATRDRIAAAIEEMENP
ncbi:DUF5753 domain-containing protein [Fodinicola feengrottensis]|uniref:DUF5753 domain-containing protein n=1 Tax=Fodinicola feengrottensis TaxID=435914 RepID=UPI0024422E32|nr:DUF5753 domain-containing protein [Fodinicola feengrottensis]